MLSFGVLNYNSDTYKRITENSRPEYDGVRGTGPRSSIYKVLGLVTSIPYTGLTLPKLGYRSSTTPLWLWLLYLYLIQVSRVIGNIVQSARCHLYLYHE